MPDETTPVQPVSNTSGIGNSDQPENWKARYDGLVRKVEQLTLNNRDLTTQLEQRTSEIEQYKAQLSLKDVEKQAAIGERDRKITEITTSQSQSQSELEELRALRLKVNVINELKRPELLKIAAKIPNITDPEALKSIFADMASFADDAAMEREKQLKAGMTTTVAGNQKTVTTPMTQDAWLEHINSLPLGPERDKAYEGFWDWGANQSKH
jgi:hypothetical protein